MEFYTKPGDYDAINYMPHTESHGTKELWRTFWILLGITILDFILYFSMTSPDIKMLRNIIFIFMGLVKAYFIVGAFMHLKNEKISLALIILVPTIFIVGLVMGLLYEGNALTLVK